MAVDIKGKATPENYITELTTRGLKLNADQPEEKGGKNTAFTSMELIGAALSSCTITTLEMYFNHKEWEYDTVEVDVNFDYASFPVTFNRIVRVKGNFDEKQAKRINGIANACPVHKLLEKGHEIATTVELI